MASIAAQISGSSAAKSRSRQVVMGRLALGAGLLLAWHLGAVVLGPDLVAAPLAVLTRLLQWSVHPGFYHDLAVTVGEAVIGVVLGTLIGVLVPLGLRLVPRLFRAVMPFIRGMMGIPKLALTPLFILWLGYGMGSKIGLITLITFIMVFEATIAGMNSVDAGLLRMSRILGAKEIRVTREIYLNSTLPYIFSAWRTAWPFSLSAAVVGEFLASQNGLGHLISTSRDMGDIVGVFAGIFAVTSVVVAGDLLLLQIRARRLSWQNVDNRSVV